jgi:hypothetical protein
MANGIWPGKVDPTMKKTPELALFSSGSTCNFQNHLIDVQVHQQKRCTDNQEVFFLNPLSVHFFDTLG